MAAKKPLYLSELQFKDKTRGDSRGDAPDKRSTDGDFDMNDPDMLLMKQAFDVLDVKGDGVIDKANLNLSLDMMAGKCEVGRKILEGLLSVPEIGFSEFVTGVSSSRGNANTKQGCDSIFKLIGNEEGNIDFDALKALCKEIGDTSTDEEIRENLNRLSKGKGFITKDQFRRFMKPKA